MKQGKTFGELALQNGEPRAASVFADSDVHCLVVDRELFNKNLAKLEKKKQEELVVFLRNVPYLKPLPQKLAVKLSLALEKVTVEKVGEIVYR